MIPRRSRWIAGRSLPVLHPQVYMQDYPLTDRLPNFAPDFLKKVGLIATDMDGTLTRHGRFTPQLLQTLEALKAADVTVLITTGRSAGWVQGLVNYLPVQGAIAENGGLFYANGNAAPEWLSEIPDQHNHRSALAQMFAHLQDEYPHLQESTDNRFRLTDWTFDVGGLSAVDLQRLGDRCQQDGWGFTYSTVQCHIRPRAQNKGQGLLAVLQHHFPHYPPHLVVTVGDSPNDQELFQDFPNGVGVANLQPYLDRLTYRPAYLTLGEEIDGFCQLAIALIQARPGS
ncbi:MAG TPA: HAD family hydrolase [Candidatus Obscuribacterales bacterium]